jgi:cytochrome P450
MGPDIDLTSPSIYERGMPHAQFMWLRANAPVFWHREPRGKGHGFWALTRHQDIVHVSRHPELFSSWLGTAMLDLVFPSFVRVVKGVLDLPGRCAAGVRRPGWHRFCA